MENGPIAREDIYVYGISSGGAVFFLDNRISKTTTALTRN
jgi:hypothetical protein